MSRHANSNQTTILSVSDVLDDIERVLPKNASIFDHSRHIDKITRHDRNLRRSAMDEILSIKTHLSLITNATDVLLKSMMDNNVVLGSIQATAYFYSICYAADAPWDFYCTSRDGNADRFLLTLSRLLLDEIESVKNDTGYRVVYYRRAVNGLRKPITIRVFISYDDPLKYIIGSKYSYEQSIISPTCAICLWPKLNKDLRYREFSNNDSFLCFPEGNTMIDIKLDSMHAVRPRQHRTNATITCVTPSLIGVTENRVDLIEFDNKGEYDSNIFKSSKDKLRSILFTIFNDSTIYNNSLMQ